MANDLERINRATERQAATLLARLCEDPADRNYGGFVDETTGIADSRNSIYAAQTLFAAYLYPDYPDYYGKPGLLEKLLMHLDFVRKRQRPDGSVSMWTGGVGGGNEVGFTLPGVCETYRRVVACQLPGRDEILAVLGNYIRRGAECVRTHFPHTSNHRWAACAGPLAVVNSLFPDPFNGEVIEEYLSDGIDIDADGLYYEERSPGYNIVASRGLILLADFWDRRDLLDLVARNLNFSLLMRQPSGEAETLFSRRQDRGVGGKPWGDYYLFKRLAVETGNGVFASAADLLLDDATAHDMPGDLMPLRYLVDAPRLLDDNITRCPLPEQFEYRFRDTPLWRYRDRSVAATAAADPGGHFFDITQGDWGGRIRSDAFMSYHVGTAVIDAIKIRWGSGTASFRPSSIAYSDDGGLELDYVDPGWNHLAHYRPRDKWGPRRIEVDQNAHVTIQRQANGALNLHIRIGGWEEMPVNIQFFLRENCRLQADAGTEIDLTRGGRTYSQSNERYTLIGPDGSALAIEGLPASEHSLAIPDVRFIPGYAETGCRRLIAGLFTPVDVDLTLHPSK